VGDSTDSTDTDLAAVRRGFELFNSGDLETLFREVFDPKISYRGDPQISALAGFPTDAEGVAGVRAVWEGFFAMFDEVQLTEMELSSQGEGTVTGSCRMVAHGGSSGIPIDAPFFLAWVLRDGRWAFMAAKLDREEALAALREWRSAQSSQPNE
jgi:ketosteroid isomerase-like protein